MSLVIVDDQASEFQYTGSWDTAGGTTGNYDHTASGTRAAGASLLFRFNGTSASLYGGYDADASCSGSFSLDSNATTFTSPVLTNALTQQELWSASNLADAEHTLSYTLTSCSSNSTGLVWFDYLLYKPSANASSDVLYFIDDTDSAIAYTGNWTATTGNDGDFQLSSHHGSPGASLSFQFEGTLVSVHGRIGDDTNGATTKATFSIDGGTPVPFSAPPQSVITFNQALFQSNTLSPGTHTLVATSDTGSLWVDYLLLQPNPLSDASTSSHSGTNVPEIAGIAVGAVFLAVVIALVVIFRRRLFSGPRSRTPKRHQKPQFKISAPDPSTFTHVSHTPWVPTTNSAYAASLRSQETAVSNPFASPPPSPRAASYVTATTTSSINRPLVTPADTFSLGYTVPGPSHRISAMTGTTSTSGSGSGVSVPISVSVSASSSGRSRRNPSLGGDTDSVAELKRRQQAHLSVGTLATLAAPAYTPSVSGHSEVGDVASLVAPSVGAVSRTSSLRPLPHIPPAGAADQSGSQLPQQQSRPNAPDDADDLPPVYTVR